MRTETSVTVYRQDYQPYPFDIPTVTLVFELDPTTTTVTAQFEVRRRAGMAQTPLVLEGHKLELISVTINGQALAPKDYELNASTLTLLHVGEAATIQIVSRCTPATNTALMGLYLSEGNFFTQCEAQGYRRITWFPDRPDVLSHYHVTLRATTDYPVLLSNGNLLSQQLLPNGKHEAVWEDPFLKPCYLFALVAGNFSYREMYITPASSHIEPLTHKKPTGYTDPTKTTEHAGYADPAKTMEHAGYATPTKSTKRLQIYSDPSAESKTKWALQSLAHAVRWDEARFGRELDLERFMVVAARDFNMGAMENKGLNIFNAAYILADPDTATDSDYETIESVIGHEYFHNWTGNRVTCRDWFQLSLKEGLTVFRDQEFSADMMSHGLPPSQRITARAVKRIDDVVTLRAVQFPEDASPMAHPIRPESYQEIGNFYTATVYEKGAEVIRMQHTLLGESGFRAGMDEYFRRHDGQAVTCDDFVNAMEFIYKQQHHGKRDLSVFRRWYHQAGTPRVNVEMDYDATTQRCTFTLTQRCAPVGVETVASTPLKKQPFHIPFAIGLLDKAGQPIMLHHDGVQAATVLLELTTARQQWCFESIPSRPIPSLLRGFSAPVIVEYPWHNDELVLLSAHDTDPFARWEACQELASREILHIISQYHNHQPLSVRPAFIAVWRSLLQDDCVDAAYQAHLLTLPAEKALAERMTHLDPPTLANAREFLYAKLGETLAHEWHTLFKKHQTPGPYEPQPKPAGQRALKNLALKVMMMGEFHEPVHLSHTKTKVNTPVQKIEGGAHALALAQYEDANNMTDRLAALSCLVHYGHHDIATQKLQEFYEKWQHDPIVIDKWFALQATAPATTVETVRQLMTHPAFTLRNPDRTRALVFQFCLNHPRGLHAAGGAGYDYWVEQTLALNALNPETAARLARAMDNWSRCIPTLREPMRHALESIHTHSDLSPNVAEIVSKTLTLGEHVAKKNPQSISH